MPISYKGIKEEHHQVRNSPIWLTSNMPIEF
ncbi:MAG: hypothetical protein ACOVP5_05750, partial [Chitinophagales bacterium]